jgi:dienelactone hydrolase
MPGEINRDMSRSLGALARSNPSSATIALQRGYGMRPCRTALILLLVVFVSVGSPTTPLARSGDSAPRFVITPERILHDREVSIQLLHLKPNQRVTVRAARGPFKSETEFVADAIGKVNVGRSDAKPDEQVAPLRILWSMKRDPDAKEEKTAPPDSIEPVKVSLTALSDGKVIAAGSFELLYLSADVERIPVKDGRLRGVFFRPKAKGKYPGVMTLSGSGGGVSESRAALLAAHGYAVFTLAYFNYQDLPKNLVDIPLEYFDEGLTWLEKQECVGAGRLTVMGGSRGGELALLLGTRFPNIKAVVAYVPCHMVVSSPPPAVRSAAWIHHGKPVPWFDTKVDEEELRKVREANPENGSPVWRLFLKDAEAAQKAAIPVEKINGPVLLISSKDDRLWPSAEMAEKVEKRLRESKHPHKVRHLPYEDAGHFIGVPNSPMGETRVQHPISKRSWAVGGTPQGNAFASWDSWAQMLVFLDETFKAK